MCVRCFNDARNARLARIRAEVRDHKLARGCSRCGYSKCADALEFHHPHRNKRKTVSALIASGSYADVWSEIARCEIVCANCHAEIHEGGQHG